MTATLEELQGWLSEPEGERLEFKEAKQGIDRDTVHRYCVAIANEGGGHLVLGVADKPPRGEAVAYVCSGSVCGAPVTTLAQLIVSLRPL